MESSIEQLPVKEEEVDIEIKNVEQSSTDPVEIAATLYGLYHDKFRLLVHGMSNKSLKRVIFALIEDKLVTTDHQFSNDRERNAFAIGDRLLEAKYMMIIDAYMKDLYKRATQENIGVETPEVVVNEIQPQTEGDSNGKV